MNKKRDALSVKNLIVLGRNEIKHSLCVDMKKKKESRNDGLSHSDEGV